MVLINIKGIIIHDIFFLILAAYRYSFKFAINENHASGITEDIYEELKILSQWIFNSLPRIYKLLRMYTFPGQILLCIDMTPMTWFPQIFLAWPT